MADTPSATPPAPTTVTVTIPPQMAPTVDDMGKGLDNYHKPPLADHPELREEAQALLRRPGVTITGLPGQVEDAPPTAGTPATTP